MPIIIKDFGWKQTADKLFINVPLKGVNSSKVDVFVSECYVKLNFCPFIFELFLKHPIDDTVAKCSFTESEAILEFNKKESCHWSSLEEDFNKFEKIDRRIDAINQAHLRSTKRREYMCKMRTELERFAVSQAIDFDSKQRSIREQEKNCARDSVMAEFEDWRSNLENENCQQETIDDGCIDRKLTVTLKNDSELTVENALENDYDYLNNCPNVVEETFEINIDRDGMWVTNLPNRVNDEFRSLDTVLKECSLHETTSVDMLFDETGMSMENSVENDTCFMVDYDGNECVYETQGVSKAVSRNIPDFGKIEASDRIVFKKDAITGGIIVEKEIDKYSIVALEPAGGDIVYEAEGYSARDIEEPCEDSQRFTVDPLSFIEDQSRSIVYDEIWASRESDVSLIHPTPYPNIDLITPTLPQESPVYKRLDVIKEMDEDFLEDEEDYLAALDDKYSGIYMDDIHKDYLNVNIKRDDDYHDTAYSDFFRTPQPPESEGTTDQSGVCTPYPESNEYSDEESSVPCPTTSIESEECEEDVNDMNASVAQTTQRDVIKPKETCQQIGVEISISSEGIKRTKKVCCLTDCSQQTANDFFADNATFDESNDVTIGEISLERGDNSDANVLSSKKYTNQETQCESGDLECLLKEQSNLLKEHIKCTETKFEELTQKLDECCVGMKGIDSNTPNTQFTPPTRAITDKKNVKKEVKNNYLGFGKKDIKENNSANKGNKCLSIKKNSKTPACSKKSLKKKVTEDIEKKVCPPPRVTETVFVSFTDRVFPTPSRESCAQDEQKWLSNMYECRKATGFACEDLRPEERDPMWCKNKGDEFYKCGNHLGAISAYTHGLKLCDSMPYLYSNRAACHYAVGNYNKCIEDCSSALDLLKPPCPSNVDCRAKCIARRAAALTRIGMLSKAIDEMKAALELQPNNCQLQNDLWCMERAWEQNPD